MANNLNMVSARGPVKYGGGAPGWTGPSQAWLCRTWTVTHSTLKDRSGAKNCRVTYTAQSPASDGRQRISVSTKFESKGSVKSSSGTAAASRKGDTSGEWESKGKGLLKSSSRWEILGWGDISNEKGEIVESWMIVYYPSSGTSKEGVDVMSSRKQGMGSETAERCISALKRLPSSAAKIRNQVVMDLRVIDISLPWKE